MSYSITITPELYEKVSREPSLNKTYSMENKPEAPEGPKKIQITRRIQLFINLKGKELTEAFTQINNWNYIVRKTANYTASHQSECCQALQ